MELKNIVANFTMVITGGMVGVSTILIYQSAMLLMSGPLSTTDSVLVALPGVMLLLVSGVGFYHSFRGANGAKVMACWRWVVAVMGVIMFACGLVTVLATGNIKAQIAGFSDDKMSSLATHLNYAGTMEACAPACAPAPVPAPAPAPAWRTRAGRRKERAADGGAARSSARALPCLAEEWARRGWLVAWRAGLGWEEGSDERRV